MATKSGPGTLVTGGILLVTGYFLFPKIKQYYQEHFNLQKQAGLMKMKFAGAHMLADGSINLDLQVMNPNSTAFSFKSILGTLSAAGHPIADLKMFGDYTVRPNDQATIPVVAKVAPAVFKALQATFKGKQVPLVFQGTVNVNDKALPMQLTYNA